MAPLADQLAGLVKRADGCGTDRYRGYDGQCYWNNTWYWWGRWVFTGVAVLFIIICLLLIMRRSRRRRQQGQPVFYRPGWMGGPPPPPYAPPPQYAPQDQGQYQGQYPPPGGYKYGQNDGYYAGQNQEGIQLQQPASTYQRGADVDYAPPPGPPPNAATKPT